MKKRTILSIIICLCICLFAGCSSVPFTNYNISTYDQVVIANEKVEIEETPTKTEIAEAYQQITVTVLTVIKGGTTTASFGSGFVVYSGGYIATNCHVVQSVLDAPDTYELYVSAYRDENAYQATILWYDKSLDCAIIHCNEYADLNSAKLMDRTVFVGEENSNKLRLLDELISIGTPLEESLEGTVTLGYCSNLGATQVSLTTSGNTVVGYNWYHYLIQNQVPINHGNSGGPLIDTNGYVVGINTLGKDGTGEQGIFFAVSVYPIIRVLDKVVMNYEVYQKTTSNILFGVKGGDKFDGQYLSDLAIGEGEDAVDFEQDGWLVKVITDDSWLKDKLQVDDIITNITVGAKSYDIKNSYDLVYARIDLFYTQTGKMTVIRGEEEVTFDFTYEDPEASVEA